MQAHAKVDLKVVVTFPLGHGPYQATQPADTLVGEVRHAAMNHFGAVEDPNLLFYLTHAGDKISDEATIGSVAGEGAAVKFTLVREIVNG